VHIGPLVIECPYSGGEIIFSPADHAGLEGKFNCPDGNVICGPVACINGCMGNGDCLYGKCVCDDSFGGPD
jgi:hypothetical protein